MFAVLHVERRRQHTCIIRVVLQVQRRPPSERGCHPAFWLQSVFGFSGCWRLLLADSYSRRRLSCHHFAISRPTSTRTTRWSSLTRSDSLPRPSVTPMTTLTVMCAVRVRSSRLLIIHPPIMTAIQEILPDILLCLCFLRVTTLCGPWYIHSDSTRTVPLYICW